LKGRVAGSRRFYDYQAGMDTVQVKLIDNFGNAPTPMLKIEIMD